MSEPTIGTFRLFRCSQCGKWSHAARMPKHHQRFVRDEPEEGIRVLREEPPVYERDGTGDDGGYLIACGPFETYEARKVTR